MAGGPAPEEALAPFRDRPDQAAVVIDYDGTISPIVEDPGAAVPLPGVPDLLNRLAGRYAVVAVVSGRSIEYLRGLFSPSVVVSGLYGLQVEADGERRDHPLGGSWREVIDDVAGLGEARGPEGMRVERKDLSLTLHYREHPELEASVREWAEAQGLRSGLLVRPARQSYELHPPIDADKGTALRDLAEGLGAVVFVGDDIGDLPAFDALDELEAHGCTVLRVAVDSSEAPPELVERADVVVSGPEGVAGLLEQLV